MNTNRNAMTNHIYSSYKSHLKQSIIQNHFVQRNKFKYKGSVKDMTSGAAKLNKNMIKGHKTSIKGWKSTFNHESLNRFKISDVEN